MNKDAMLDLYSKLENKLFNKIKEDYNLKDFLTIMTKEELNEIRKKLELKGISNLKKQELIVELQNGILNSLDNTINKLNNEEKEILKSLVENKGTYLYNEKMVDSLIKYRYSGIVFSGIINNQDKVMIIPQDLILPIKEIILDSPTIEKAKCNKLWIDIIRGLLYYYGVLDIECAHKLTANLCCKKIDFYDYLMEAVSVENPFYKYNSEERIIYLKEVEKPFYIMHQQSKIKSDYLPITMDMVHEVCSDELFGSEKEIYNLLLENPKINESEAREITKKLIIEIRNGRPLKDSLKNLFEFFNFKNLSEANRFINSVSRIYSKTIMWNLKGYTPYEMNKINNNKGTTVIKHNKIGRNDPCICGSGKKYKKCCGAKKTI
ncbi:SEC-C metal-binding domain-containing protein [Haloimpatiens massiliensis]|uniref:SEC-C metal-binding domain-containing protein n=1 Tax=Haloimpatiens massiliensis TaxID=1658110 RepID=UPI000C860772|nr:SEC-C metal-binding domain-containing protein [Haloimpatiens massiliensis]